MRLLVVVDTYVPARISAALQMRDLVREMRVQGHLPTVVVPAPELTSAWRLEDVDGVPILRVRTLPTKDVGKLRRTIAEWRLPYAMLHGLRLSPVADIQWDGLVWYSPTIFLGPIVRAVKQECGCRAYLILRDLFPAWALDIGVLRKGLIYWFFKYVERSQYALANVIGVQTPANIPIVAADSPPGAEIETLHNWLKKAEIPPQEIVFPFRVKKGQVLFVYAGNMGAAQGTACFIDLARRLGPESNAAFLFVGRGVDVLRLRESVQAQGLTAVHFMDEIGSDQIPGLLAQCHVGLIALDPRHSTHNIPGKLIPYLHAGLPVLARINPGNDLEALVNRERIGFAVAGNYPEQLERYAKELIANESMRIQMGQAGRMLATRMFAPETAASQVIRGLSSTAPPLRHTA